jgi:NAD(P)-dependent dehydrogenase (short-subunit alcohol dehydrogenase family)
MRFDGRVALVTGAGRGLGRAYAEWLAGRGAKVVVNNRTHPGRGSTAQAVVDAIRGSGGVAVADGNAVETEAGGKAMVEAAFDAFGRLDVIVCNAAISFDRVAFEEMPVAQHREAMEINYWGSVYPVHAALKHMKQSNYGRVVFSTSTAGCFGQAGMTSYGSTKTAVLGLARCLAVENAERNLRFNCISPFAVTGEAVARIVPPALHAQLAPEKVAPMVGWLCSEGCTQNGMVFFAGGGRFRRRVMAEGPRVDFEGDDLGPTIGRIETLTTLEDRKHSGVAGIKLIPNCSLRADEASGR